MKPRRPHRPHAEPRVRRPDRLRLLPAWDSVGGVRPGSAAVVQAATGVPEAQAYGTATFYHLLARPEVEARVCTGTSCRQAGAATVLDALRAAGVTAASCACLGQCDQAPAVLVSAAHGDGPPWLPMRAPVSVQPLRAALPAPPDWRTWLQPLTLATVLPSDPTLALDLGAGPDDAHATAAVTAAVAIAAARRRGAAAVLAELEASGLRGRGGAGFPAHLKWRAVARHAPSGRPTAGSGPVIVCNADEGEPGTFKDREVLLRRPTALLAGMAIAADLVGAADLIVYLRGEQTAALAALQRALTSLRDAGALAEHNVEIVLGHGAYICGEETALLEALEGRRGMPRHKPPFPTDAGYLGRPTLLSNVETFAVVPGILRVGGAAWAARGVRGGVGMRLFSVSGDVARPGVYELPVGTTMRELVEVAGGMAREEALAAFVPGGAASGILPASQQDLPLGGALDAAGRDVLAAAGSMAGSGGVIALDQGRDIAEVAQDALDFFRDESCGQCAPCRIGSQVLATALRRHRCGDDGRDGAGPRLSGDELRRIAAEVGWEMAEGSICGLGQAAPLPLQHLLRDFAPAEGAPQGASPAGGPAVAPWRPHA